MLKLYCFPLTKYVLSPTIYWIIAEPHFECFLFRISSSFFFTSNIWVYICKEVIGYIENDAELLLLVVWSSYFAIGEQYSWRRKKIPQLRLLNSGDLLKREIERKKKTPLYMKICSGTEGSKLWHRGRKGSKSRRRLASLLSLSNIRCEVFFFFVSFLFQIRNLFQHSYIVGLLMDVNFKYSVCTVRF